MLRYFLLNWRSPTKAIKDWRNGSVTSTSSMSSIVTLSNTDDSLDSGIYSYVNHEEEQYLNAVSRAMYSGKFMHMNLCEYLKSMYCL